MKNHLETFTDDDLSAKMKASVFAGAFIVLYRWMNLQITKNPHLKK